MLYNKELTLLVPYFFRKIPEMQVELAHEQAGIEAAACRNGRR